MSSVKPLYIVGYSGKTVLGSPLDSDKIDVINRDRNKLAVATLEIKKLLCIFIMTN